MDGFVAVGGGHLYGDGRGHPRLQRECEGCAASGTAAVHRHRRGRVGGDGGHLYLVDIQRGHARVPVVDHAEGGERGTVAGDGHGVAVLVGQRK